MSNYTSDLETLQNAVSAAQQELAVREVAAQISATPANNAAVNALQERVVSAEQALNDYNALHNQPVVPIPPVTTIGLSGPPPVVLSPPPTVPIPAPSPGAQTISTAAVVAALDGYLSGENVAVGAYIDATGEQPTIDNAWNYLVDQVENVFTDIEGTLEGITATGFGVETGVAVAETAAGVTAEIGSIEVVGFATALLLGEYITGWLIQQLGGNIPDPGIFGWHPLGFIKGMVTDVGNSLAGAAEAQSKAVIDIIVQPVRMLTGLFQRVVNAVAGAHDKTARIVTNTVPTAVKNAIATAEAYTDTQQLAVTNAANQALIDLTPPPTLTQARTIISDAERYQTLGWAFEGIAAAAIVSADEYADTLHATAESDITGAITKAESYADNQLSSVEQSLIAKLTGDETTLSAIANSVNVTLPAEIATQVQQAEATENQALTATSSTIEQQIAGLQAQIATLNATVTTANQTIATAQGNIAVLQQGESVDESAIAAQQATITAAQTQIATTTTAISGLYTQLTGISNTLGPVRATQALQAQQISGVSELTGVVLPTAIATLAASLTSLKTQVDTCTVDNCDPTNPNNIRNVLRDLLGLFTAAAEIGFVAEAVRDPQGTANALAPLLDSIDSSAVATLNALLSL